MDGDDSTIGLAAMQARSRAQQAMVDGEFGPANMPAVERAAVDQILAEIFPPGTEGRAHIDTLLSYRTWAGAYEHVKKDRLPQPSAEEYSY